MRYQFSIKKTGVQWLHDYLATNNVTDRKQIFELIKTAMEMEKDCIKLAYTRGCQEVDDCATYGYDRRFAPQYYAETHNGGRHDNCKPMDPNIKSITILNPATGKVITYKGGEQ